jgi:hypothetical protein
MPEQNGGLDWSIPMRAQVPQIDVFGAAMRGEQLRGARESRQGLAEQRRLLAEQRQRAIDDQKALDMAVTPGADLDAILAKLPGHMHATVTKQWGEASELAAKAKDAKAKAETAEADYFGNLAATLKVYQYDPETTKIVLSHAKSSGHDTSQIEELLARDPSKIQQIADALIEASPAQRTLRTGEKNASSSATNAQTTADKFTAEKPGIVADSEVKSQVAAGTVGGVTPAQKLVDTREQERIRLERDRVQLARQAAKDAEADVPTFTPEALDMVANNFAMTGGQLPPMGMGAKAAAARTRVINRAAEIYKGLDLGSQRAAYDANKASLKTLEGTKNAIGAFEKTAQKNIDLFLEQAGKVVDTGSPMANSLARQVSGRMLGSPDQAAYEAARQVAITEIAKITQGGGLSGVLSDSARHEIAAFNPQSATLRQTVAVMRLLKKDMENRGAGLDEQIAGVKKLIATPPGEQPAGKPGASIKVGRFTVEAK